MTTNTITTTKARLTNRMKKLGEFLKVHKDDVDLIYNKIAELFPKSCEVSVYDEEKDCISFILCEEYIGKQPSKKEMLKSDSEFKEIIKVWGLMIGVRIEDDKITLYSDVSVDYKDKWGNYYNTNCYIKEMEINL